MILSKNIERASEKVMRREYGDKFDETPKEYLERVKQTALSLPKEVVDWPLLDVSM